MCSSTKANVILVRAKAAGNQRFVETGTGLPFGLLLVLLVVWMMLAELSELCRVWMTSFAAAIRRKPEIWKPWLFGPWQGREEGRKFEELQRTRLRWLSVRESLVEFVVYSGWRIRDSLSETGWINKMMRGRCCW